MHILMLKPNEQGKAKVKKTKASSGRKFFHFLPRCPCLQVESGRTCRDAPAAPVLKHWQRWPEQHHVAPLREKRKGRLTASQTARKFNTAKLL